MKNPIEKAASMAENISYSVSDLIELDGQVSLLMKERRGLFKVENIAKKRLTNEINGLKERRKEVVMLLRREYPMFNEEAFRWRDRDGYPLLALFELDDPKAEIGIVTQRRWRQKGYWFSRRFKPQARFMHKFYGDVTDLLKEKAKEVNKSMRLRTDFQGVIPDDVRSEIAVMRSSFKDVYIVAEVEEWDLVRSTPMAAKKDPLVLGYEGGKFFLIAAFDTTPLEAYLETLSIKDAKK